jgi:hypothetical protein
MMDRKEKGDEETGQLKASTCKEASKIWLLTGQDNLPVEGAVVVTPPLYGVVSSWCVLVVGEAKCQNVHGHSFGNVDPPRPIGAIEDNPPSGLGSHHATSVNGDGSGLGVWWSGGLVACIKAKKNEIND